MEKSLFKIASELIELDERMVESGGELTDDIELDLALVTTALVEKTDGVVEYAKYNDSAIKAVSDRIKELTEIKKKLEKKQERFNDYVLICMDKLNTEELNGNIHKIKIRKPNLFSGIRRITAAYQGLPASFGRTGNYLPTVPGADRAMGT